MARAANLKVLTYSKLMWDESGIGLLRGGHYHRRSEELGLQLSGTPIVYGPLSIALNCLKGTQLGAGGSGI